MKVFGSSFRDHTAALGNSARSSQSADTDYTLLCLFLSSGSKASANLIADCIYMLLFSVFFFTIHCFVEFHWLVCVVFDFMMAGICVRWR